MNAHINHNCSNASNYQRKIEISKSKPDWKEIKLEAKELAEDIRKTQFRKKYFSTALRKLKAIKTTIENWLINRKRNSQGREDFLPLYFIWTSTRACNFRCTYCCDHRGSKYPDLPNKGVLSKEDAIRLFQVMRTRTPSVYYAGGEPLLRADLNIIANEASRLGYFPQTLNTNGSLLHNRLKDPAWSNFLSNLDVIVVSLDSLDLQTLGDLYVYNRPENIIRNILALNELKDEYRFKLMINCVIRPGEIQDANDVLDFANENGITFTGVPENSSSNISEGLLDDTNYQDFIKKLLNRHREGYKFAGSYRFNERLYTARPLVCRNTLKPHIDFDGRLFWPCKASKNVSPLMIPVLQFSHIDEIWNYGKKIINPDNFHGQGCNQCGGQCNWAQNYSTDCYTYGLKHPSAALKDMKNYAAK